MPRQRFPLSKADRNQTGGSQPGQNIRSRSCVSILTGKNAQHCDSITHGKDSVSAAQQLHPLQGRKLPGGLAPLPAGLQGQIGADSMSTIANQHCCMVGGEALSGFSYNGSLCPQTSSATSPQECQSVPEKGVHYMQSIGPALV